MVTLWIGTDTGRGGEGIYRAHLDSATGQLARPELAAPTPEPTWLTRHPAVPVLYSVSELPAQGWVRSWSIGSRGVLEETQAIPSGGGLPCHLAVIAGEVWAANYEDGAVLRAPLDEAGQIGAPCVDAHRGQSVHARQAGPHAHCVAASADGVLVADLGTDSLWHHGDGCSPFVVLPAGCGPRTLAALGDRVFLCGELDNHLYELRGRDLLARLPLLPGDTPSAAAQLTLHPDGRRLFVANRGPDSISVFDVSTPGRPERLSLWPTVGRHPRHFAISPDGRWLLVANRDSHSIVTLDAATGRAVAEQSVPAPTCVLPDTAPAGTS